MFNEIRKLIREGEEELGMNAGLDPPFDSKRTGYIKALRDILDVDFDFPEED